MEGKMAKARSPGYPAIGLKDAIDKVKAIYDEDYQSPIPRAVAAQHMGYASLNGKSLGVLSALIKYGLLEGRGNDTRVSDLAVTIIAHEPGASERATAIRSAAARPELFSELDSRFKDGKASDQAIRSYLMTQKFIPAAADAAIRSYRETKQLAATESAGYASDVEEELLEGAAVEQQQGSIQQQKPPAQPPPGDPYAFSFSPSGGIEVRGRLVSEAQVDRLIEDLGAMKRLLRPSLSIKQPRGNAEGPREEVAESSDRASKPSSLVADNAEPIDRTARHSKVSLMITQAQKSQLRDRGYTDDEIHEMRPEEAHRVLGLTN
jgi:hypothetical protein